MSKSHQLTIVLPPDLRNWIEHVAESEDRSIGGAVRRVLEQARRAQAAQAQRTDRSEERAA